MPCRQQPTRHTSLVAPTSGLELDTSHAARPPFPSATAGPHRRSPSARGTAEGLAQHPGAPSSPARRARQVCRQAGRARAAQRRSHYDTSIGAVWGYASAEVLINLKVLDGTQVKGSNRLSLVRPIPPSSGSPPTCGSGAYTLSCEFDHSYGTPRSYAALVELKTWAGGGGAFVVSSASAPRRGPFAPGQPTAHASGRAPRAHGGWHRPCPPRPRPGTGPSPRRRRGHRARRRSRPPGLAGSRELPQRWRNWRSTIAWSSAIRWSISPATSI